jgi:CYTH domain-containing protein
MAREIERKYLVAARPPDDSMLGHSRLRQAYLAVDGDVEVRVRDEDGATVITIKAGEGRSRVEVELPIEAGEADALWPYAGDRLVEKVRYRVSLSHDLVAELDVYEGPLVGLRTVEVEFPSEEAASAFTPPDWFGREVTGDAGWSNAELATRGAPVAVDSTDVW